MKIPFRLLAFFILITACQQPVKKAGTEDSTAISSGETLPAGHPVAHYLLLKGTLAGKPVTMHLLRSDDNVYDGWYYYDSIGEPIALGYQPDSTGLLKLVEYSSEEAPPVFAGTMTADGRYKGTFTNKATYDFDLKEDRSNAVQFEQYHFSDSANMFYNNPKSPMALGSATIIWPVGGADDATLALIRQAIAKNITDPKQAIKVQVDSFLQNYIRQRNEVDSADLQERGGASWNWNEQSSYRVVWNRFPLLVIEAFNYSFTGGAHGNYGSLFTVIDLHKKKVLTPADVFKPGYEKKIGEALEDACRKKYNIPAGEALESTLIVNSIEPNKNFFITDKGVIFSYTPYEIGPYVMGQITLFIPFREIKDIVNEAYLPS